MNRALPPFANRKGWHSLFGWVPPVIDGFEPYLTILPNKWGVAEIELTPELAAAFLGIMVDNQRRLPTGTLGQFVADIQGGRWRATHQGIAFNRSGKLFDGQTRCQAVLAAGLPIRILAFFGVGDGEEMLVVDTGKSRSRVDAAHVGGLKDLTNRAAATVIQAITFATPTGSYNSHRKLTNSESFELFQKYGEQAGKVTSWFGGRGVRHLNVAAVRAAVFTALVCDAAEESVLERFVGVFLDAIAATEPADSAARLLRQFILNNGTIASQPAAHDLFLRACTAIQHTIRNNPIQSLRPISVSPWVMPENRPQEKSDAEVS